MRMKYINYTGVRSRGGNLNNETERRCQTIGKTIRVRRLCEELKMSSVLYDVTASTTTTTATTSRALYCFLTSFHFEGNSLSEILSYPFTDFKSTTFQSCVTIVCRYYCNFLVSKLQTKLFFYVLIKKT